MTLTEFILARIAEDEGAARGVDGGMALPVELADYVDGTFAFIERLTPARVLAECEAKRAIVERCADDPLNKHRDVAILELLALPYAEHPDYREEWRA